MKYLLSQKEFENLVPKEQSEKETQKLQEEVRYLKPALTEAFREWVEPQMPCTNFEEYSCEGCFLNPYL